MFSNRILLLICALSLIACTNKEPLNTNNGLFSSGLAIGTKADPFKRFSHDISMLVDPATGELPLGYREKELEFFKENWSSHNQKVNNDWQIRGPWNVGGRTRAFVIDKSNESVLLAGAASGGVWKSVDAGQSWYKVSHADANTAVTSLIQDPRPGHELDYYYTTGELSGASQSGAGAFYLGRGVYKSLDGGESWENIISTSDNTPQTFNSFWEGLWRIAIDPSNMDETELYVASYGNIYRSVNGGDTWNTVISSSNANGSSYFTDVTVTDEGVVYATLSYEDEIISFGLGPNGGIYRSPDGVQFTDIRPDEFPEEFSRTVVGVDPSDSDRVFFLSANVDSLSGFQGEFFNGGIQYSSLWRYQYLSGDGTGSGGEWNNLTENLPSDTGVFDDFYPQSGYDLAIAVSPADPDLIVIGGTNLYRSSDGFSSTDNTRFIGGYAEHSAFPEFTIYPGHHPDIHGMVFLPSNPQVMFNVNDGGIFRTDDVSADTVSWTSLNQGYLTTQVYGLGIEVEEPSAQVVAGMQDNGNHYVNSFEGTADWTLPVNGDGCYTYFAREHDYVLMSIQLGRVVKCLLDEEGNLESFERIDPGLEQDGHDFIHPYVLSPNDDGTVYFPYQNKLYVHRGIDTVSLTMDYEANLEGWEVFQDSLPLEGLRITAISAAEDGTDRLYLGTDTEKIYRIDDATDLNSEWQDVTMISLPNAHIDCIAIDPFDSDKAMVVFTNYNVYSLYYTSDAGETWQKAAGDLEQFSGGTGNGPSCRWATIHRWHPDSVVYFVGTSIGLFSTTELEGIDTHWEHEAAETIANTVVSYVTSREIDRRVFAGTHGNGVHSAVVEQLSLSTGLLENEVNVRGLSIFPNPASGYIKLDIEGVHFGELQISLLDLEGSIIKRFTSRTDQTPRLDISGLTPGVYHVLCKGSRQALSGSFVKVGQ